ncbi:MAG TPA: glycosyltransferase [Rudaea sp.]
MRVLHIGKFFPPHPGGIERSSADLTAALAVRGVGVAMLAHADPGTSGSTQVIDGVEVSRVRCHGQLVHAPLSPDFPFALRRAIRRFRPDLLHLHVPNTSAFWALLSPAARRIPWVVHWHSDVPLDAAKTALRVAYRVYRPWEQALLRRAAAVIATSQPYCDASVALNVWREKVSIIPLGIDDPNRSVAKTTSWPADGLRILAVGRLSYYKGFDVLLQALAQLPSAQLLLIGDGPCEAALRAQARELRIADRVRFAGRVDDDELAAAYASADGFCLPSTERSEAFGLVLLEAMRARLPTVASAIPGSGVGFVVADGETGLLAPPRDADALARALAQLADPELRTRLGAAGERRWKSEFTLDRAADRTLALYRSVLEKTQRRAAAAQGT